LLRPVIQTENIQSVQTKASNAKRSLRKKLRRIRHTLSNEQQAQSSKNIIARLYRLPKFLKAQHLAYYRSFDGEVDLALLGKDESKTWFLPITSDTRRSWERQRLIFQPDLKEAPMLTNQYGIQEPLPDPKLELKPPMLDIVLMPLVGFDRLGNRLGMGNGYYDRTFGRRNCIWRRPLLIGIAHAEQECENLMSQPWDIPLDWIVTGSETIDCRG